MKNKIAILGAGGHGKVVGEIAYLNQYETINFFDKDEKKNFKNFPFPVVGNMDNFFTNIEDYDSFFVAIGDNEARSKNIKWLIKKEKNIVNLIHPNSTVSKFCSLNVGICIMAHAVINPGTLVGVGSIINTSASLDHDCIIEDYVHISPNCSLSGGVKIGKFSHLGTGTSVHPGINIGYNVKTGIGSKVFKNISDKTIHKD